MQRRPQSERDWDAFVGGWFVLHGLTREDMNGRYGQVIGRDAELRRDVECRLHVRLSKLATDDGQVLAASETTGIRVKPSNLVPFMNVDDMLNGDEVRLRLAEAVAEVTQQGSCTADRPDILARVRLARRLVETGEDHTALTLPCQDVMGLLETAEERARPLVVQLNAYRFPCKGDGRVRFERFGQGVPADGRLDPGIFLPRRMQITRRFKEYMVSGLCERCQFAVFEAVAIFEQT